MTIEDTPLLNKVDDTPSWRFYYCVVIAVISSFLFGYNTGVIAGAILEIELSFIIDDLHKGFLVSVILVSAVIGSVVSGHVADNLGRRKTILLNTIPYILGPLIMCFSPTYWILVTGRFITGIGVGVASTTTSLYISEISPPKKRGSFGMVVQFATASGIFISYVLNFLLLKAPFNWRLMLGFAAIPALVQLIFGYFLFLETPRFLVSRQKIEEAKNTFFLLSARPDPSSIDTQIEDIKITLNTQQKPSWENLGKRKYRRVLLVGLGLNAFQPITGINVVIYYASVIFESAGFSKEWAVLLTLLIAIPQLTSVAIAVFLIDRVGRRVMLFISLGGMICSLTLLGIAFFIGEKHGAMGPSVGWMAVIGLLVYRITFSTGMGPIPMLISSEIYPSSIRGICMSVSGTTNWISNFIVSLTFLSFLRWFGSAAVYWMYGGISLLCLLFVIFLVPETKGRTLEELEKSLITE